MSEVRSGKELDDKKIKKDSKNETTDFKKMYNKISRK